MTKYLIIMLMEVQRSFLYKFDFLVGLLSQGLILITTLFLWRSIYQSSALTAQIPYQQGELLQYLIIANFLALLFSFIHVLRLSQLIKSGKLTMILSRPISLLAESFAVYLGNRLIVVIALSSLIVVGQSHYSSLSPYYWFFLLVYLFTSVTMFFLLLSLISTLSFWVIQMWPLRPLLNGFYLLLGGLYFPLDLLPEPLYQFLKQSPFALAGHLLTKSLQGLLPFEELIHSIGVASLWSVVLYVSYRASLKAGLKRFEGVGH